MSRQMVLAFMFMVLFLTLQGDWNSPEEARKFSREQKLELHRDSVKEKLILDLTGESKKLQDQLDELKKTVQKLQQELSSCLETGEGRSSNRTILSSDVVNKNSLPRMSSRSSSSVSHPKSDSQDDDHDVHEDSFQGSEGSDVLRERKDSDQYERERISSKSFVASNERDNDLDLNPEQG